MKTGRLLSILLASLLLLCACGKTGPEQDDHTGSTDESVSTPTVMDFSQTDEDMFTKRDSRTDYEESESVRIQLNGDTVSCTSDAVRISGTTVTITGEGTYILSGSLEDGRIVVDADKKDKLQLVLDGVSIHCETSAPLYILQADKVFLTLADGSANTLSNGGTFTAVDENNIDGAIFSKQDLTLNGSGSLTVESPAGHGIVCKDDLVITGGTYMIHSASHGLDANDSVRIKDASLTIEAGKDGIHAENKDDAELGFVYLSSGALDISAEGDGISAGAYLQIEGGSFAIVSGGGAANSTKDHTDSMGGGFMGRPGRPSSGTTSTTTTDSGTSTKGLKASGDLLIRGGTFAIDSADDAVHANGSIVVNGGTFEIATGDDGFHADESLTITSGSILITESYEGLEALHILISGGDIKLTATDDGVNAAGGTDSSGFGGFGGNDQFGGGFGGPGGGPRGGGLGGNSTSNGSIVIAGGTLYIKASGDGIDANGTLEITGGHIIICGPTQGDTATLDYDVSGVITGGTFIGTGAAGMAQSFSDSEQGVIAIKVGKQSAGVQIVLKDMSGNTILSHTPELPFEVVILSSPELVKGETYSITVGSSTGEVQAS